MERKSILNRRNRIYKKQLAEKEALLGRLFFVNTPKSHIERADLKKEITDLKAKCNEVDEKLEQVNHGYKQNIFMD